MTRGRHRRRLAALALAAVTLAGVRLDAASRCLPSLRFRVLQTAHFLIYFHQHEAAQARRLARVAEEVYEDLTVRLRTAPGGRTHVLLLDQNDSANGWATPLPYDTIEIDASWPAAHDVVGNTTDWLRLVFAHEFTHILQLDRSAGVAGLTRRVFGRSPLAFANLFLPSWQVEGLATFEESAVTGRGRIAAGDFRVIVDEAARAGKLEPLDRAGGDQAAWPSGQAPYAYGGFFHEYLAKRFGEENLGQLAAATARRFYFLQSPAFKRVFGRSLGELWTDFEAERGALARSVPAPPDPPARVTFHGFLVRGPRFIPSGPGDRGSPAILYSLQDAHDFPSLRRVAADGTGDVRVASRFLGDAAGVAGGRAWFSQLDLAVNVALRSDLYVLDLATGRSTRVTNDGRLLDPDVAPDGRAVAAIALGPGRRALAVFDVDARAARPVARLRRAIADPARQFSSPRWSPDGRRVAVASMGPGDGSEIVIVDAVEGSVRTVVSSARGRNVTPAWTPDGRTILFASDRDGGPFGLFAVDVGEAPRAGSGSQARADEGVVYRLPPVPGGASEPDVSGDGRRIAYVGYTTAGYDVFTLPLDRAHWEPAGAAIEPLAARPEPVPPATSGVVPDVTPAGPDTGGVSVASYSPFPTLVPRYWLPTLDVGDNQVHLGAGTGTSDVLGRHAYAAAVSFRFARDAGGLAYDGPPDWSASYAYDRWRETLFLGGSDSTTLFPWSARANAVRRSRDREWVGGVSVPFATVRHWQALVAEVSLQRRALEAMDGRHAVFDRNAARFAWSFNTSRWYGYSISPEQGVAGAVTTEHVRRGLGADGNADAGTADVRGYLRLGGPHSVLASRLGLALASGDAGVRRQFYLGGAGPVASPVDFGTTSFGLLRGFADQSVAGRRAIAFSLEYRVPIARIERGHGTWPLFVRTISAAGFLDAGNAFDGPFRSLRLDRSYGAEVSLDLVLGFGLPLACTAGIAVPRDAARPGATGPTAYVRLGRSF